MAQTDDEVLMGIEKICRFMGISKSYWYRHKIWKRLDKSGILFKKPGLYGRDNYYSHKRLILAWMIEVKDL